MTWCEYTSECETAQSYDELISEALLGKSIDEATSIRMEYKSSCNHNHEICPERKKLKLENKL